MSRVNSGLGWSCDSEYYVSDGDILLGSIDGINHQSEVGLRQYFKKNEGPAICAAVRYINSLNNQDVCSFFLLSTSSSNTVTSIKDKNYDLTNTVQRYFTVGNVKWYYDGSFGMGYYSDTPIQTSYPFIDHPVATSHEDMAKIVLASSGIKSSVQTIPVNWTRGLSTSFDITVFQS